MHAMSRVRNTQSRAQDELTQQQGNGKRGTLCAGQLSHNTRCDEQQQPHNSHCANQKLTHVDSAGRDSGYTKNITCRHQNNVPIKHVNLRTAPRREYRMLFAEFSSQGGRSTPTSQQSPFPSPHATFLVLAWQALVRDLWTTPVVRYSLSRHLCAPSNVCSQALDCASALDRVCRFQPLYLLMAPAKPAP